MKIGWNQEKIKVLFDPLLVETGIVDNSEWILRQFSRFLHDFDSQTLTDKFEEQKSDNENWLKIVYESEMIEVSRQFSNTCIILTARHWLINLMKKKIMKMTETCVRHWMCYYTGKSMDPCLVLTNKHWMINFVSSVLWNQCVACQKFDRNQISNLEQFYLVKLQDSYNENWSKLILL